MGDVIQCATAQQRAVLCRQLRGFVAVLATSKHANHVIQKLIEVMPGNSEEIHMIAIEILNDFKHVVADKFGCRVVQRLVEHVRSTPSPTIIANDARLYVLASILKNAQELCSDEFGHFAVETLLEFGEAVERQVIVDALKKARHGKAAYVMQKAIDLNLLSEPIPHLLPRCIEGETAECDSEDQGRARSPVLNKPGCVSLPEPVVFNLELDQFVNLCPQIPIDRGPPGSVCVIGPPPGVFLKTQDDTQIQRAERRALGRKPKLDQSSLRYASIVPQAECEPDLDQVSCCSTMHPDDVVRLPRDRLPVKICLGPGGHVDRILKC